MDAVIFSLAEQTERFCLYNEKCIRSQIRKLKTAFLDVKFFLREDGEVEDI